MRARRDGRGLRGAVLAVVFAGFVLPILAGLAVTAEMAFGHLPAIGATGYSTDYWWQLAALPGATRSLGLSIATAAGATGSALVLAFALVAWFDQAGGTARLARLNLPFLAAPHAAMAIGLAFVISPSGWIARMISPWATGWAVPPDLPLTHDPAGLVLTLGLTMKEMPFLALVMVGAAARVGATRQVAAARALGYRRAQVWIGVMVPQIYRLIRLPVYAVLVFSLSVVDMAVILGPSNPPTLAQAVTRWLLSPDIRQLLPGAAGALGVGVIAVLTVGGWMLGEKLLIRLGCLWIRRGRRGRAEFVWQTGLAMVGLALMGLAILSLGSLVLWSFAWQWRFPDALPASWSVTGWKAAGAGWRGPLVTSLLIGSVSATLALLLAIAWLEAEDRGGLGRAGWAEALIYLPLLVPQVAFLYGLQTLALRVGFSGGVGAVIWGHILFVFPYVMIALSGPWRAFDRRLLHGAALLGAGSWRRLIGVRLPCLLVPILTAAAIGFSVSVAQYLPTLFLGEGRVATLTTEAVTLSSGADRRIAGIYGLLQTVLPLLAYVLSTCAGRVCLTRRPRLAGPAT